MAVDLRLADAVTASITTLPVSAAPWAATTAPLPVVALPDEIDMATAGALGEQFAAALVPGVPAVIADMTATTF